MQTNLFSTPIPDPEKGRALLKEKLARRTAPVSPVPAPRPQGRYLKVKIEDAPEFERRTGFTFEGIEEHPLHGVVFKGQFQNTIQEPA